eukprot:5626248-Amphidinium_carterae.1
MPQQPRRLSTQLLYGQATMSTSTRSIAKCLKATFALDLRVAENMASASRWPAPRAAPAGLGA